MKLLLTRCPECGGSIRSDGNYCDYCGKSLGPPTAPHLRIRSFLKQKRKPLIIAAALAMILGIVWLIEEPWYEPLAPRPDEVITSIRALESAGLEWSALENRSRLGDFRVSVIKLSDGSVYQDFDGLPFSDVAFLVTFRFPIREARYNNTQSFYKIFDGYVDEKWSRFSVTVSAQPETWRSETSSSEYVEGPESDQPLPIELEVLDTNQLVVVPEGIPEEGYTRLTIWSPPGESSVYYNKTTREAYYYGGGYVLITDPGAEDPEPITGRW